MELKIDEALTLNEMAMPRADVIYSSSRAGKVFLVHFDKLIKDFDSLSRLDLKHHCQEMQSWWDYVRGLTFKHNKKHVSDEDMKDWFFSAGGDFTEVLDKETCLKYEQLIKEMLKNRNETIFSIVTRLWE